MWRDTIQPVVMTCCNRGAPNCSHGLRRARARYQIFELLNKLQRTRSLPGAEPKKAVRESVD